MTPEKIPLALRRNASFLEDWLFTIDGAPVDLSGMTFHLQFRLYGGQPGAPVLSLALAPAGGPGLTIHPGGQSGVLRVYIAVAQLEAMPKSQTTGDPTRPDAALFSYDLMGIYPDAIREIWVEGVVSLTSGTTVA